MKDVRPIQPIAPLDEAVYSRNAEYMIGEALGIPRAELTLVIEGKWRNKFPNEDEPQQLSRIEITAIAGMKILLHERIGTG